MWGRDYQGLCEYTNNFAGKTSTIVKRLNEYSTFIRYPVSDTIIFKVTALNEKTMDSMVTTRKPFGLATNVLPLERGDLVLRYNKGKGSYDRRLINTGKEYIDKWKVMISYLSAEHAGQPDKSGMFKILSTMEILPPGHICTETYLLAGWFDTKKRSKELIKLSVYEICKILDLANSHLSTYHKRVLFFCSYPRLLPPVDGCGAVRQIWPHGRRDHLH